VTRSPHLSAYMGVAELCGDLKLRFCKIAAPPPDMPSRAGG
jgi:hypothetical protein